MEFFKIRHKKARYLIFNHEYSLFWKNAYLSKVVLRYTPIILKTRQEDLTSIFAQGVGTQWSEAKGVVCEFAPGAEPTSVAINKDFSDEFPH